ncbi:DUF6415 family natural product biosynthesis protein [Streptomyces lannensis]|uniref:DUF6415 family natural product biosynthesis protein n=1 Tax=Streptomyces lannensis TaxID=766498 RepID=UPI003CD0ABD1
MIIHRSRSTFDTRPREQRNPAPGGDVAYARRLARALNALCDHYEALQPPV